MTDEMTLEDAYEIVCCPGGCGVANTEAPAISRSGWTMRCRKCGWEWGHPQCTPERICREALYVVRQHQEVSG